MNPTFMVLLTLALGVSGLRAGTNQPFVLKTITGETYRGCRIIKVTPSYLTVMHEQGVAKVGLELLNEELKAKFNYSPANAKDFAEAESRRREEAMADERDARERWERAENERLALLLESQRKQIISQEEALAAALSANSVRNQPLQPLVPMPNTEPMPAVVPESVVPSLPPLTHVYTPGLNDTSGSRYGSGLYYSPGYPAYSPIYAYPRYPYFSGRVCPPVYRRIGGLSGDCRVIRTPRY